MRSGNWGRFQGGLILPLVLTIAAACQPVALAEGGGAWESFLGKPYAVTLRDEADNTVVATFRAPVKWSLDANGTLSIQQWDDRATFVLEAKDALGDDNKGRGEFRIANRLVKERIAELGKSLSGKLRGNIEDVEAQGKISYDGHQFVRLVTEQGKFTVRWDEMGKKLATELKAKEALVKGRLTGVVAYDMAIRPASIHGGELSTVAEVPELQVLSFEQLRPSQQMKEWKLDCVLRRRGTIEGEHRANTALCNVCIDFSFKNWPKAELVTEHGTTHFKLDGIATQKSTAKVVFTQSEFQGWDARISDFEPLFREIPYTLVGRRFSGHDGSYDLRIRCRVTPSLKYPVSDLEVLDWNCFTEGAEHHIFKEVRLFGVRFTNESEKSPLVFRILDSRYVYVSGQGTARTPDGRTVSFGRRFVGAEPAHAPEAAIRWDSDGSVTDAAPVMRVVIRVRRSLNLLEPELPPGAIGSITPTVAHVYRIVPVQLAVDELTVAADKALCREYLDELRWFVPVKTIKAVTVSQEHLSLALDHYYSVELEAEAGPLVRAVCMVLKPDVAQVRLTTLDAHTSVHVTRSGSSDAWDLPAPNEVSPNAVARLKKLAGIGPLSAVPQHGAISLGEGDQSVIIDVEAKREDDTETLILTVPQRNLIAGGG